MIDNIKLEKGERLDDLCFNNMYIVQNKEQYCFTSDSVLLANFIKSKKNDKVVDLCSGSGVVGILFYAKNNCEMTLVEMQEQFCKMQQKTLKINGFEDKIKIINCKVQDTLKLLKQGSVDIILCNPPYKKVDSHKITEKSEIAKCKYELMLTFDELCLCVSKLLKFGGKFCFVHDSSRLCEIITTLKKYNLETKIIQLCYPKGKEISNVVLIEAIKNGKSGCTISKISN